MGHVDSPYGVTSRDDMIWHVTMRWLCPWKWLGAIAFFNSLGREAYPYETEDKVVTFANSHPGTDFIFWNYHKDRKTLTAHCAGSWRGIIYRPGKGWVMAVGKAGCKWVTQVSCAEDAMSITIFSRTRWNDQLLNSGDFLQVMHDHIDTMAGNPKDVSRAFPDCVVIVQGSKGRPLRSLPRSRTPRP